MSTGTSVVGNNDTGTPTASFTFYIINCTDGTREEIPITGDGEFLIFLPIDGSGLEDDTDDCDDGEPEVSCVSGATLSTVVDTSGCRVVEHNDTYVTCGCTHLTAFSALFVPGGGGGCGGGEWEWDALKTAAATLLAFCVLMVVVLLLAEHFLVFKKRKQAIKSKTRKRTM